MKITTNNNPPADKTCTYPYLGVFKDLNYNTHIVLFTAPKTGIRLLSPNPKAIPYEIREDFLEELFIPYQGTITLSN